MINKVTLIGHLGKDPEIRTLESGATVARFSVATNENYRDRNNDWQTITEWHNVVAWRNLADRAGRDLKKGSLVYIEGKITTRKWQDRDGNDRYSTDIVANTLRLLEKRESGTGMSDFPSVADEPFSPNATQEKATHPTPTSENVPEDDLPF